MAMFQSNLNGSYGSHYFLRLYIDEIGTNAEANTSTVKYRLTLYFDGSSYYAFTNDTTYGNISAMWEQTNGSIGSLSFSSGVAKEIELMSTTRTVTHNDDGSGVAHGTGNWDTATSRMGSGSVSGQIDLTKFDRYTTVTSSERGKTLNSISVNWKTTDPRWWTQYSLNGGEWKDAGDTVASDNKSGYYTITGLTPNTRYSVKTRCKRNNSSLWSESNTIYITTYDIAKINSLPNFDHGNNVTINITNPANITTLNLVMKISSTQILSRNVKTGNNTITFSDTELDNIYKKYGTGKTLTATFVLTGSGYTNTKTCTITFTGNQKTIRIKIGSNWKRGKLFIKQNGTFRKAVIWIKVSGAWKRGI